jgi:hypothetical protein
MMLRKFGDQCEGRTPRGGADLGQLIRTGRGCLHLLHRSRSATFSKVASHPNNFASACGSVTRMCPHFLHLMDRS